MWVLVDHKVTLQSEAFRPHPLLGGLLQGLCGHDGHSGGK